MGIILVGIIALVALTAVDANLFPAKTPDARSGRTTRSGRVGRNRNAQQRLSPRERLRPPTYQDRPVRAFRSASRQKRSGARWWWEN